MGRGERGEEGVYCRQTINSSNPEQAATGRPREGGSRPFSHPSSQRMDYGGMERTFPIRKKKNFYWRYKGFSEIQKGGTKQDPSGVEWWDTRLGRSMPTIIISMGASMAVRTIFLWSFYFKQGVKKKIMFRNTESSGRKEITRSNLLLYSGRKGTSVIICFSGSEASERRRIC